MLNGPASEHAIKSPSPVPAATLGSSEGSLEGMSSELRDSFRSILKEQKKEVDDNGYYYYTRNGIKRTP